MVEVSAAIPSSARILINPVLTPLHHQQPLRSREVDRILQTFVPQQQLPPPPPPPPSAASSAPSLPLNPPPNILLLIKPQAVQPLQPPQPQPAVTIQPVGVNNENPLDLSCKPKYKQPLSPTPTPTPTPITTPNVEPFAIRRANSCSAGSGLTPADKERRLKRKEQNKAAAQSYRQRKKSFSGLIDNEHDMLTKRNLQLKAQKQKLEDQIAKIRGLLNEVIEDSKRAAEESNSGAISDTASEPPSVQSPSWSMESNQDEVLQMRSRKYTWPMALTGKERKKEQNKLASRRFRQRRKMELSNCEIEAQHLEATNRKLKERCEELEGKIKLLKDLMNKSNAMKMNSGDGEAHQVA